MARISRFVLIFIIGTLASSTAWVDHPSVGFGSGAAGPIVTVPAVTLPKGSLIVALRFEHARFDAFSDAALESLAARGVEAHSTGGLSSTFLSLAYGFTDDLTIGFHIPYVVRRDIREGHLEAGVPEVHVHGDSRGLGDLTVLGQYRFARPQAAGVEAALLAGLKLPTGETRERDGTGVRFETEHQPGSGSWDPLLGLAVSKRLGRASLDANVLYGFAGEGAQEANLGDLLNYNAAISYRFGAGRHHSHEPGEVDDHAFAGDVLLEANGEWRQKQRVSGAKDPNSGGSLLFLSPGARLTIAGRLAAYLSLGLPIRQDLNGTQHETDWKVTFGLGWRL